MEKPEKVVRKYNKSDVLLLQQAQTMLENFTEDMAEFTAKYPTMNAAYATAWQDAITAADAAPDDDEVVSEQKQKTLSLIETMRLGENKYGALVTYLKLIHKDKAEGVLDHFGYKRLRRSRFKQMRLKELLDLAYERANSADYKPALIAKGFLQADIDELNALAQQLEDDNKDQEKRKTDRPEAAQERILLHHAVWDIMNEVNIASTVVFADDYARQQHYLLYPEKNSSNVPVQVIETVITLGATNTHSDLPENVSKITVTVLSGGVLEFGLSNDGINFLPDTILLEAPVTQTYPLNNPFLPGQIIMVKNHNLVSNGSYKIEIFE